MSTQSKVPVPPPPPGMKPAAPPMVPSAPGKPPVPGAAAMAKAPNAPLPAGAKAGPGQGQPGEEDEGPIGPQLSFWQLPWVQNILPFVTSLSIHAGVLIIGLMAFGVYKAVTAPPAQEQVIVPDSNMVENGPPGGIPNQGPNNDPLRQAMQDKDPTQGSKDAFSDTKSPTNDPSPEGAAGDSAAVFAVGGGGSIGGGKGNSGSGNGQGGGMAMFGTPGGGGIGPKGPVFGNGGNARLITFVCDASGSMINKMASLKDQLNKAIVGLRPIQSFNVVFFQDAKCDAVNKDGSLIPATPENKRKAGQFLEGVTTTGTTDPIPGIQMAFKSHPQLIYILTDGDFPDNEAVLKAIRDLNKDKKVKINTIAFVGASDTDTAFLTLLQTIAKENGGTFKHVNEGDL